MEREICTTTTTATITTTATRLDWEDDLCYQKRGFVDNTANSN